MHAMRWLKQSRETVCRPSGPTRKYTNVTVGLSNTCQLPQSTKHMTTTQHTHAYRDVVCREAVDDELVKAPILARALNALHELTKLSRHDNNKSNTKTKKVLDAAFTCTLQGTASEPHACTKRVAQHAMHTL